MIRFERADASEWHGRFDLPDLPQLWAPAEPDDVISRFRDAVRARLGMDVDARLLLERQRAILAMMSPDSRGEAANVTLLLDGRTGSIISIGCLDAMLWKCRQPGTPCSPIRPSSVLSSCEATGEYASTCRVPTWSARESAGW